MRKLKIWWLAWVRGYPFFRVIYKNGERTYPLYESEAIGLRDVFDGKMIVDYEYANGFLKRIAK